eukprot:6325579-Ditylum_brightwellii.AAC.1
MNIYITFFNVTQGKATRHEATQCHVMQRDAMRCNKRGEKRERQREKKRVREERKEERGEGEKRE